VALLLRKKLGSVGTSYRKVPIANLKARLKEIVKNIDNYKEEQK